MRALFIVVSVLACAGASSVARAQAACPEGTVADGSRCVPGDPPPPTRWLANNSGELYTADTELRCVAPAGGACAEVQGLPVPLGWGLAALSGGYAISIATAILTSVAGGQRDGRAAAVNAIPLLGPTLATAIAIDAGGGAGFQFTFGILSSLFQLAGTVLTLVGALATRTATLDAEGHEVELVDAGELRWIGPTGFALAF